MNGTRAPYRVASWRFWYAFGVTMRPYLLFVSGASGLVGLALGRPLGGVELVGAAVPFFVAYGLGQAITDAFQTDTDALSAPYRPLVRGEITRAQVLAVSIVALLAITALYAWLNPWTMIPAALAVAGIVLYTPFKRRWWGGPPWNSWVVATLPLIGVLLGGGTPSEVLARGEVWLAMGSVYFSYAVFVLLGYFKDVEADRATGYDTMVVRFGRPASVWVSAMHAVLALGCSAALLHTAAEPAGAVWPGVVGGSLWIGSALAIVVAHFMIASTSRDQEAHPAIALVVVGYVGLHFGETALLRPALTTAVALIFPVSVLTLACRRQKTQV